MKEEVMTFPTLPPKLLQSVNVMHMWAKIFPTTQMFIDFSLYLCI